MECSQSDIDQNAKAAEKLGYKFGAHGIKVLDREEVGDGTWSVTFAIYGDKSEVRYEAVWGDTAVMWVPCPSELGAGSTPEAIGDPPAVGTECQLYFSKMFLENNKLSARPKWPLELSGDLMPIETLEIFPQSLVLRGIESLSGRDVAIELLDTLLASPRQSIQLDGGHSISVGLTPLAVKPLGLPFYPDEQQIVDALSTLEGDRKDRQKTAFAWSVIGAAASGQASGSVPTRITGKTQKRLEAFLFRD